MDWSTAFRKSTLFFAYTVVWVAIGAGSLFFGIREYMRTSSLTDLIAPGITFYSAIAIGVMGIYFKFASDMSTGGRPGRAPSEPLTAEGIADGLAADDAFVERIVANLSVALGPTLSSNVIAALGPRIAASVVAAQSGRECPWSGASRDEECLIVAREVASGLISSQAFVEKLAERIWLELRRGRAPEAERTPQSATPRVEMFRTSERNDL